MLVTMVAWLRCVPIVAAIAMLRSLVRRPVQNKSVRRQCSTNNVLAAVAGSSCVPDHARQQQQLKSFNCQP